MAMDSSDAFAYDPLDDHFFSDAFAPVSSSSAAAESSTSTGITVGIPATSTGNPSSMLSPPSGNGMLSPAAFTVYEQQPWTSSPDALPTNIAPSQLELSAAQMAPAVLTSATATTAPTLPWELQNALDANSTPPSNSPSSSSSGSRKRKAGDEEPAIYGINNRPHAQFTNELAVRRKYPHSTDNLNNYGYLDPASINQTLFMNADARYSIPASLDTSDSPIKIHILEYHRKTRVETQVNVSIILDPLPPGIKRLHLPRNTVGKPKYFAKQDLSGPETFEVTAMVFCTSAMCHPDLMQRAFAMARGEIDSQVPRRLSADSSSGSSKGKGRTKIKVDKDKGKGKAQPQKRSRGAGIDPNDAFAPTNGGEVRICRNCMNREVKRAHRKQAGKFEEGEDEWELYASQRTVMFNCEEYRDFVDVYTTMKDKDDVEIPLPDGLSDMARRINAPMRIMCYCRHQGEKIGFRVIFTIRDHKGNIVCQQLGGSILITDDHKNPDQGKGLSIDKPQLRREYHSATDLVSLQQNVAHAAMAMPAMPPSLSRPASPSPVDSGPKKRRKGSSTHQLPSNLFMTPVTQTVPSQVANSNYQVPNPLPSTTYAALNTSPRSMNSATSVPYQFTFGNNPSTPGADVSYASSTWSFGDGTDGAGHFYSAPASARGSRAASPVLGNFFGRQQQNALQLQMPLGSSFAAPMSSPPAMDASQGPIITTVTPHEGSVTGGIEVTILGANFDNTHVVRFGESDALTTLWGDRALHCILPAGSGPGIVPVTIINATRVFTQTPERTFTYVDDTDKQLAEQAIRLLALQSGGSAVDVRGFAQAIVNSMPQMNSTPYNGTGATNFSGQTLSAREDLVLALLEKVDVGKSSNGALFDLRRENGATMMSLAAYQGYTRLLSVLVSRGANPDTQDNGGYTPLMMAALRGHLTIVKRLILAGADSTLRNRKGFTAEDLAASPEIRTAVNHIRHHLRSRSTGTPRFRSRANSEESTRSLWGPPSPHPSSSAFTTTDDESGYDGSEDESEAKYHHVVKSAVVSARTSRRGSAHVVVPLEMTETTLSEPVTPRAVVPGAAAETTAMHYLLAWRDHLTNQINLLQQSAARTVPNISLSNIPFPSMPNLQDQSGYNIGRRISSLVPIRSFASRSSSTEEETVRGFGPSDTEADDGSLPPPPYSEICPNRMDDDFDVKPPEIITREERITTSTEPDAAVLRRRIFQAMTARQSSKSVVRRGESSTANRLGKHSTVTIGKNLDEATMAQIRRMKLERSIPVMRDWKMWYLYAPALLAGLIWIALRSGMNPWIVALWQRVMNDRPSQMDQPIMAQ